MDSFADEGVREITCKCSAQSGKTLTLLALVCWIIAEDPGPILWVTKSVLEAKKLMKTRLKPILGYCPPVAEIMPTDKSLNTLLEVYFPGAPLIVTGAESPASLQSTPFRYVIMDEARSYPKGAVEMASKRTRSFTHSSKRIIISTPDKENDVVDRNWKAGDQREFLVKCPCCGDEHKMEWGKKDDRNNEELKGGLKWDTNEETCPGGVYDFDVLLETVRYECWNPECDHVWRDTASDRKYISSHGRWVVRNPNAPKTARSFSWHALLPWWAGWKDQVREFLIAKAALEMGDMAPLKDHMNETRGEDWTDRMRYGNDDDEKAVKSRARRYDPKAEWEEEVRRFMTIDVQGKGGRHFKYVIRSWGVNSRSRLLTYGVAWSIDEIKDLISEWDVDPDNVAIDSGKWTKEVYMYCVESGYHWKAFKGDDKYHFTHRGERRMFTESSADPALGTKMQERVRSLPLYIWAKYGVIDQLMSYWGGVLGDWQVFGDVGEPEHEEYLLEVTAVGKRDRELRDGKVVSEYYNKRKDDHWSDCEQMQIVCADASGMLSALPLFDLPGAKVPRVEDERPEPGVFDALEDEMR